MDSLSDIQSLLDPNEIKVGNTNFLFLDLSSTCTGYTLVKIDFLQRKAKFLKAGAIWFAESTQIEKCGYVYNMIVNYFNIIDKITFLVMEEYRINPKKLSGCLVSPELHGSVKAALNEVNVKMDYMPVSSWRKILNVKKNADKDFKQPTKEKVLTYVEVPESMLSNVTHNKRNTPSDVYDSLAISLAWLKKYGINSYDFTDIKYQEHVGVLNNKGEF